MRRLVPAVVLLAVLSVGTTARAAGTPSYQNPVFDVRAFPDPMVLAVGTGAARRYYGYATGTGFPIIRSPDLVHWTSLGLAMDLRPTWVVQTGDSHPWAPSALERPQPCPGAAKGPCYLLYHVGRAQKYVPATDCIGIATSPSPEGPFTEQGILTDAAGSLDASGRPIGCGDDAGYQNIDPAPFVDDDGTVYLYVSTGRICPAGSPPNAACPNQPTISVIPMAPDGLHATGGRMPLFAGDPGSWEQAPSFPVVENPWMVKHGSGYHLLYSGADYTARYGMGEAVGSSPLGPFTKVPANPFLTDTPDVISAGGGATVIGPDGREWLAYFGRAGSRDAIRTLRVDPLTVNADGTFAKLIPTVTFQDHDPPETTITAGPPAVTNQAAASVAFAASETSTFACAVDAAPARPCASPLATGPLADGPHRLLVTATDIAGNVDPTPAVRTWTVDTRAPRTRIVARPEALEASSRASFSFRADEPGAGFTCSLDRGAPSPCRAASRFDRLAPGAHTLLVRAEDRAGNVDPRGAKSSWTVLGATRALGLRAVRRQAITGPGAFVITVRCARPCRAGLTVIVPGDRRVLARAAIRRAGPLTVVLDRAARRRLPTHAPLAVVLTATSPHRAVLAAASTTLLPPR